MHEEIIEGIRGGNLDQLDQIYIEVKPSFLSYARKSFPGISSVEVEDVYQESIIELYKNIIKGSLQSVEISFASYVIHIGKMKLIRLVEQKQKNKLIELTIAQELLTEDKDERSWEEVEKIVEFIFSSTDASCKAILEAFYFKQKSMDEIAKELGYKNADVVKSKKYRCINSIYEKVKKMKTN